MLMQFVMTVDILKTTSVDKLPNDLEGMEASMERLLALIDDIYKYVDNVVVSDVWFSSFVMNHLRLLMLLLSQEGQVKPDNTIGRFLADTVASLPKLSPSAFDKLMNDNVQVRLFFIISCIYHDAIKERLRPWLNIKLSELGAWLMF